jgi:copper homeostasis protein CutC
MIARKHPVCNWLRLPPAECRRTLDRVLQFRDSSDNPMASGMPEAAVTWFWESELPRLLTRADVRKQAIERLQELQDTRHRLEDQIQMQAGALLEQQAVVELEHQQLAALVEVSHGS